MAPAASVMPRACDQDDRSEGGELAACWEGPWAGAAGAAGPGSGAGGGGPGVHAALTEQAPVRRRLLGRHAEEQLADPVEVLGRGAGRSARAAGRLPRPPPPAPLTSLYMGSRRRDGWYCSHSTVNTVSLPLKRRREGTPLTSARPAPRARARGEPPHTHPSTASSRNQRKLSSGCTKGGPPSMDGCFRVYVENTTDALRLFFKQRNLRGGRGGTGSPLSAAARATAGGHAVGLGG